MIDDDPDLERKYRAPRAFGPAPGPRNIPFSQRERVGLPDQITTSLAVTLAADGDELTRLLPPHTRLVGPAALTVTATRFENLLWLAGRGYPILTVTFPVEYTGPSTDEALAGMYLAVLWEGLADPVTTGREELGFPKLFANISSPRLGDLAPEGNADAEASWDGFRFFDLSATGLQDAPLDQHTPPTGTIVHRYVPTLGAQHQADIEHLVYHPRSKFNPKRPTVTDRRTGAGRFSFRHAQFSDMPVQYTVVNTLAALSLADIGTATLTRTTAGSGNVAGGEIPTLLDVTAERRAGAVR